MRPRASILAVAVLASLLAAVAADEEAPTMPMTFNANLIAVNAARSLTARVRMTIDRWTTDEERQQLAAALREGETTALASAMEKLTVGYLQIDSNLRWPIRVASTWKTSAGRKVRLATNRPIAIGEAINMTRSLDYPIGVIEFTIPDEGTGEGTLLAATKVRFDPQGRIEVTSLPQNTGPQQLTGVRQEVPRSKKKDKGKKGKEDASPEG